MPTTPSLPTPADFGRRAGFHDVVQRDDRRRREIGVLQLASGLVEHLAEPQWHELQVRRQRFEFAGRQGGEKVVLARTMNCMAPPRAMLAIIWCWVVEQSVRRRCPGNRRSGGLVEHGLTADLKRLMAFHQL